jgi:hypothetical protein
MPESQSEHSNVPPVAIESPECPDCQSAMILSRNVPEDDGAFVVLVHITVGGGLSPYRDAYLVGCATHEEAEAKVRDLYPTEPNLALYVSPLRVGDAKGLKLARNEVRPWHHPQSGLR